MLIVLEDRLKVIAKKYNLTFYEMQYLFNTFLKRCSEFKDCKISVGHGITLGNTYYEYQENTKSYTNEQIDKFYHKHRKLVPYFEKATKARALKNYKGYNKEEMKIRLKRSRVNKLSSIRYRLSKLGY
jgi:hypothetical protein